mmetsp:Transcript_46711/g.50389  ORF Transcript_46711/g.50389 Transcript_46711/m.50389 type:complete len:99 (+) Transcript_46711:388-684(+)
MLFAIYQSSFPQLTGSKNPWKAPNNDDQLESIKSRKQPQDKRSLTGVTELFISMTIQSLQKEMTDMLRKFQQVSNKQRTADKADDIARKDRRFKETIE